MKVRESGMPEKVVWEKFFDSKAILATLGLDDSVCNVAELGCGYGTFTIPTAETVKGIVYAFDIEHEMVGATKNAAEKKRLSNIKTILRDFVEQDTGLKDESVDYVMLFNILHIEHPEKLLREAWRILKKEGRIGIIHWNYDVSTPRGPSMAIRPKPEQCIAWALASGFYQPHQFDLKPYHYGIVMRRRCRE